MEEVKEIIKSNAELFAGKIAPAEPKKPWEFRKVKRTFRRGGRPKGPALIGFTPLEEEELIFLHACRGYTFAELCRVKNKSLPVIQRVFRRWEVKQRVQKIRQMTHKEAMEKWMKASIDLDVDTTLLLEDNKHRAIKELNRRLKEETEKIKTPELTGIVVNSSEELKDKTQKLDSLRMIINVFKGIDPSIIGEAIKQEQLNDRQKTNPASQGDIKQIEPARETADDNPNQQCP